MEVMPDNQIIPLPESPRILVVLMGSLGDVARGLCLLKPLRRQFPTARISWLVEPTSEALVRLHPDIDRVVVFQRKAAIRGVFRLLRELRAEQYDVTLDLQRHAKSGFFSFLSRAPRRIGFHRSDAKELNWLWNTDEIGAYGETINKVRHYLAFLAPLGIPAPAQVEFGFENLTPEQLGGRHTSLKKGSFVAVVMGSRWESKDYPLSGIVELVGLLKLRQMAVVLVGGKDQINNAKSVAEIHPDVTNIVGETTIPELMGVLKQAAVAVGPDSGPGHLCSTLGKKYITLFGPTSATRTAPFGSEGLAIESAVACRPCYLRKCPGLDKLCLRLIHPTEIMARIEEVVSGVGGGKGSV